MKQLFAIKPKNENEIFTNDYHNMKKRKHLILTSQSTISFPQTQPNTERAYNTESHMILAAISSLSNITTTASSTPFKGNATIRKTYMSYIKHNRTQSLNEKTSKSSVDKSNTHYYPSNLSKFSPQYKDNKLPNGIQTFIPKTKKNLIAVRKSLELINKDLSTFNTVVNRLNNDDYSLLSKKLMKSNYMMIKDEEKAKLQPLIIHNVYFQWIMKDIIRDIEIRNQLNQIVSEEYVCDFIKEHIREIRRNMIDKAKILMDEIKFSQMGNDNDELNNDNRNIFYKTDETDNSENNVLRNKERQTSLFDQAFQETVLHNNPMTRNQNHQTSINKSLTIDCFNNNAKTIERTEDDFNKNIDKFDKDTIQQNIDCKDKTVEDYDTINKLFSSKKINETLGNLPKIKMSLSQMHSNIHNPNKKSNTLKKDHQIPSTRQKLPNQTYKEDSSKFVKQSKGNTVININTWRTKDSERNNINIPNKTHDNNNSHSNDIRTVIQSNHYIDEENDSNIKKANYDKYQPYKQKDPYDNNKNERKTLGSNEINESSLSNQYDNSKHHSNINNIDLCNNNQSNNLKDFTISSSLIDKESHSKENIHSKPTEETIQKDNYLNDYYHQTKQNTNNDTRESNKSKSHSHCNINNDDINGMIGYRFLENRKIITEETESFLYVSKESVNETNNENEDQLRNSTNKRTIRKDLTINILNNSSNLRTEGKKQTENGQRTENKQRTEGKKRTEIRQRTEEKKETESGQRIENKQRTEKKQRTEGKKQTESKQNKLNNSPGKDTHKTKSPINHKDDYIIAQQYQMEKQQQEKKLFVQKQLDQSQSQQKQIEKQRINEQQLNNQQFLLLQQQLRLQVQQQNTIDSNKEINSNNCDNNQNINHDECDEEINQIEYNSSCPEDIINKLNKERRELTIEEIKQNEFAQYKTRMSIIHNSNQKDTEINEFLNSLKPKTEDPYLINNVKLSEKGSLFTKLHYIHNAQQRRSIIDNNIKIINNSSKITSSQNKRDNNDLTTELLFNPHNSTINQNNSQKKYCRPKKEPSLPKYMTIPQSVNKVNTYENLKDIIIKKKERIMKKRKSVLELINERPNANIFDNINELRYLSPEQFEERLTKQIDQQIDGSDYAIQKNKENHLNGFMLHLDQLKTARQFYIKNKTKTIKFRSPITFATTYTSPL